jgi:hypothetical protein
MKIKLSLILVFLIILTTAGIANAGKFAGAFLENGIGARALGMGGAFVSLADDGTAPYWNPAGVGYAKSPRFTAMHAFLFDELANHDFLSVALPLPGDITVGVSWIRLGIDDIPEYARLEGNVDLRILDPSLRPDGTPDGYFSDAENAYFFTFSRLTKFNANVGGWLDFGLPMEFGAGATIKYINHNVYEYAGTGTGLDVGMLVSFDMAELVSYRPLGWFSIGVNAQDVANTEITWNTPSAHKDNIERNFKTGVSYKHTIPQIRSEIKIAADADSHYGYSRRHYGLEFIFNSRDAVKKAKQQAMYYSEDDYSKQEFQEIDLPNTHLALRVGSDNGDLTAGAGLKLYFLNLDYAFVEYELGITHRVSLQLDF